MTGRAGKVLVVVDSIIGLRLVTMHLVGEISFLEGKDSLLDHKNDRIRAMVAISLGNDINSNSSISCIGTVVFTDLFENL